MSSTGGGDDALLNNNIMTIQILKNFTRLNKIFVTSNKTPIYTFYLIPTLKIDQDCSVYGVKTRIIEFWFLFWCIKFKK